MHGPLTLRFRLLLVAVPAMAAVLFALSWSQWPIQPAIAASLGQNGGIAFWIGVTLLASSFPVKVARGSFVSVSAAPIIAAGILGGPTAAGVVAVLGTFELRELRGGVPWYGLVYNHAFIVLPAIVAGWAYLWVAGTGNVDTVGGLVAAGAAGATFVVVDIAMSALAVAARDGRALRDVLAADVQSYGLTLVGLTPIAWLMALAYTFVGPLAAPVFALPLYTTRAAYKAVVDVRNMFTQTVRALASAIDARDPSTRRHSDHVSTIAVEIGQVLRLSEAELEQLEWAGLLHDIGKIGIRDAVLLKPERLTREERILMNEHPVKGEEILKDVDQLARERPLIRHHHEWFNGSGYPDRLVGEEIPLLARVLHVADAFEAMTASRPYRPVPLTAAEALAELRRYAGIQFDPAIVEAFAKTKTAQHEPARRDDAGVRDGMPAIPMLGQVAAERAGTLTPASVPAKP
jgi:HD domain